MRQFIEFVKETDETNILESDRATLLEPAIVLAYYYDKKTQDSWALNDSVSEADVKAASSNLIALRNPPAGSEISTKDMIDLLNDVEIRELGLNIADKLQNKGVTGKAIHTGRLTGTLRPSWTGKNKTAKTDIIIGQYHISLKAGAARLMSAKKDEAHSTFMAAVSRINDEGNPLPAGIHKEIEDVLKAFNGGIVHNETKVITDYLKKGTGLEKIVVPNEIRIIKGAEDMHKKLMDILKRAFETNPSFKTALVLESMTGKYKFAPGDPATADHVLIADLDGKHFKFHAIDHSYAASIASNVSLSIAFKTTSQKKKGIKTGARFWWSAFSLTAGPKSFKESENLDEGLRDFVKWGQNFLSKALATVKAVVKGGFGSVMDFFGIEVKNVSFKFKV